MEEGRKIWIAHTGQILFGGDRIPRAMPSATMFQAYGLRTCLEPVRNGGFVALIFGQRWLNFCVSKYDVHRADELDCFHDSIFL